MVKVIASSLRKGNVVEHDDGKLYVILTAENIHPGKGNSVTQVDMRRIVDGVKVTARWRTVEMVERAEVDEREYQYLYNDGEGYHFMEPETYEQMGFAGSGVAEQHDRFSGVHEAAGGERGQLGGVDGGDGVDVEL